MSILHSRRLRASEEPFPATSPRPGAGEGADAAPGEAGWSD